MDKNISEKMKNEIKALVEFGDEIIAEASDSMYLLSPGNITNLSWWVSKIGQIIKNLYPPDNQYLTIYNDALRTKDFYHVHQSNYRHLCVINGVIKAIQDEYEKGLLVNISQLLKAEIFADFLEMSEYLLKENYKDAAAVIIGSVLEDSLRKIATANGINILKQNGDYLTLEPLNQELAKNDVYNKLVQKQITSWGDLRNNAAHGNYDKYDAAEVKMMLLFVQKFCSDYLK